VIVGLGGDDRISALGGDDLVCGGDGNDLLVGGEGNDRLAGEGGNDVLVAGLGDDELLGGAGLDRASYRSAAGGVVVNLAAGTASGEGADTLSGVEELAGSPLGDSLTGSNQPNQLAGGDGDDNL